MASENDALEEFLKKNAKNDPAGALKKLNDADVFSLELLSRLSEEDMTKIGFSKIPAKYLPGVAKKALKAQPSGDHRKGNFGDNCAYSENGDAIAHKTIQHNTKQFNGNGNIAN